MSKGLGQTAQRNAIGVRHTLKTLSIRTCLSFVKVEVVMRGWRVTSIAVEFRTNRENIPLSSILKLPASCRRCSGLQNRTPEMFETFLLLLQFRVVDFIGHKPTN